MRTLFLLGMLLILGTFAGCKPAAPPAPAPEPQDSKSDVGVSKTRIPVAPKK